MEQVAFFCQKLLNGGMRREDPFYLGIGHLSPDPTWRMKAHSHEFHEMIFVARGRMQVSANGERWEVGSGDVALYPAGLVHTERADSSDPVESYFISFRWSRLRRRDLVRAFDGRGRMLQMARWLYEDRLGTGPSAKAERHSLLASILTELTRAPRDDRQEIVSQIHRHIYDHVADRLTLADLAAACGLSKYHFLRRYKRAAGRTPMQDVRAIRIGYARDLLLSTGLPLKEVAPRAGLGDEYSLSRLFRRELGMSPGKFRRFFAERSPSN